MRAPSAILLLALCCSCGSPTPDAVLDIVFDPCEPVLLDAPGATAAQRASMDDALAMWRAHGAVGPTLDGNAAMPSIEVRFEEAAPAFHGLYDDELGIIFINSTMTDRRQVAITVAHELGHALGMWHVGDRVSVMNPGNLDVTPTDGDQAALEQLWGSCGLGDPSAPDIRQQR